MDKVLTKSRYDLKLHKGFYYFHMLRKSTSLYFYILAGILSIYLAVQNTLNPEVEVNQIMITWGIASLFIIALPIFTIGKVKSITKQHSKERGDSNEIIEITKYKIVRFIENKEGKIVLGWEQFESVYEVKNCFYMYIDKDRGLVLPKADIIEGNVGTLRKLIQNNLKLSRKGKTKFKKMYKG